MLRFYGRLARRAFPLLWEAFKRGDVVAAALTFVLGAAGLTWLLQIIPSWVPAGALGLLFFYGLLRANYEEFQGIEGERNELFGKLREKEKRAALQDLLGAAHEKGCSLPDAFDNEARKEWEQSTYDLLEAAFGRGTAQVFRSDLGKYTIERLVGFDIAHESKMGYIGSGYFWLNTRIKWLEELIADLPRQEVRPDFDPQDWMSR